MLFGQNKHWNLGCQDNGICIGNATKCNGVRLNLWDGPNVNTINGINISGLSRCRKSNGLSVGVLAATDTLSNGVKVSGLATYSKRHNGLALSGCFLSGEKYNGVGLAGLSPFADTLNGFFAGFFGVVPWIRVDTIHVINGVALGGAGVAAERLNGFAFGFYTCTFQEQYGVSLASYNRAEELHGIQFGLINYAGNNRRIFRWLPLVNFHFR